MAPLLPSSCFHHVVKTACCFTLQSRSPPTGPLSVGISFKPLLLPALASPHAAPHICMSCGVSAKVHSDVMGPDGSIFPADSHDCHAQVYSWVCVCVSSEPTLHVMGLRPSWLVSPMHLRVSSVRIQAWQLQVCEAAEPPASFSMLYFTWFSILLPPFLLLLPLTMLFFHAAELGIEGGDSHILASS